MKTTNISYVEIPIGAGRGIRVAALDGEIEIRSGYVDPWRGDPWRPVSIPRSLLPELRDALDQLAEPDPPRAA